MGRVLRATLADRNPVAINEPRNVHTVWKSQVRLSDGQIKSAHIKLAPPAELIIEAVCALLGRFLGLNVPQPMFVHVPPSPISPQPAIAFGMESLPGRDVRHLVNEDQSIVGLLVQWEGLPAVAAFDELLANWDRHGGNVMYDGATFYLIDHGMAFDRCAEKMNKMGDLINNQGRLLLQKMYDTARMNEPQYSAAPLEKWLDEMGASAQAKTFVVGFLHARANQVEDMLRTRYGHRRLL